MLHDYINAIVSHALGMMWRPLLVCTIAMLIGLLVHNQVVRHQHKKLLAQASAEQTSIDQRFESIVAPLRDQAHQPDHNIVAPLRDEEPRDD
jgi:hypothetical protein